MDDDTRVNITAQTANAISRKKYCRQLGSAIDPINPLGRKKANTELCNSLATCINQGHIVRDKTKFEACNPFWAAQSKTQTSTLGSLISQIDKNIFSNLEWSDTNAESNPQVRLITGLQSTTKDGAYKYAKSKIGNSKEVAKFTEEFTNPNDNNQKMYRTHLAFIPQ